MKLTKAKDDVYKYYSLLVNTQINYAERLRQRDTPMAMSCSDRHAENKGSGGIY
ncbi:MAG: hypothetical protein WKG06_38130 [Segetibacter sp.]